ncbi:MAG: hypothetical protein J4224_00670 [Candidatus Diapherotrites archaeon]|uniref:Uncharacterized protein n=1 Tax=Candidatus Iainarchaeum sp. TaxID=3101447 RepID=A0A7J4ISH3_9ARCH|nr:MAG: hypothetical protein QT03_C0001G0943 [archaeon GW2011_AR10]MBS3058921.1 hypothetical protein [Candidatus Diapherotrites archaeon]HIH08412.1 hypothetical protein [Candidatus Diapherotrites archaeon]
MGDTTTIQVKKKTVSFLDWVKKKHGLSSYDGAIQQLGKKEKGARKSMFGAHPKMKQFKRQEEDFHDL